MTKRIRAKYKIDRRLGQNIWGRPKSPLNKRESRPGQHGEPLGPPAGVDALAVGEPPEGSGQQLPLLGFDLAAQSETLEARTHLLPEPFCVGVAGIALDPAAAHHRC